MQAVRSGMSRLKERLPNFWEKIRSASWPLLLGVLELVLQEDQQQRKGGQPLLAVDDELRPSLSLMMIEPRK